MSSSKWRAIADVANALARVALEDARPAGTLLPLEEAARLAATSKCVLRDAIRRGELPAYGRERDCAVRHALDSDAPGRAAARRAGSRYGPPLTAPGRACPQRVAPRSRGSSPLTHAILKQVEHALHHPPRVCPETGRWLEPGGRVVDTFAAGVFDRRAAEGKSSVGRERRIWKARISPRLGALPVATVPKETIGDFRDYLDAEVRARIADAKGEAGISGKTAMILWTLVRTVFKEAVNGRDRTKRVRSDDPTHGVLPPLKTRSRKKTFIFPNEFAALMACELVLLGCRELYAIAAYLYLWPGELRALTWERIDRESGVASVVEAFDEEAGETKETKTQRGQREVPIPATLLPLLESMRRAAAAKDLVAPLLGRWAQPPGRAHSRAPQAREHRQAAPLRGHRDDDARQLPLAARQRDHLGGARGDVRR